MTSLFICSGWPGTRRALTRAAECLPGVDRVESAATLVDVLPRLGSGNPDVLLLDTELADAGLGALGSLAASQPEVVTFLLTARPDSQTVSMAAVGRARGILRPDLPRAALVAVLAQVPAAHGPGSDQAAARGATAQLTERELQVLTGMCQGKSNGAIGRGLYLSEDTVKTHARRLFRKLGVNDRAHAVASGFRLGLVS
ncbi:MAG: response regulator transcription factor [Actinomycetota bacterium]|nr:response regulator transcription factor [Actinomycetota bacterium]